MKHPSGIVRNIEPLLKKCRNRIHRVGIELEGGWTKLPKGTALIHDGSVRFAGAQPQINLRTGARMLVDPEPGGPQMIGELPSPPLEVSSKSKSHPWTEWVKQFYPSHVNDSCGMHVHMSFRSALTYQRLMTPDYQETLLAELIKWARNNKKQFPADHHIWDRLHGKNRYCQKLFMAEAQAQRKDKSHDQHGPGHRYTAVNYAYGQHQTVECRVLPMMETVDVAIDAITQVLAITNAFLVSDIKREQPIIMVDPVDDDYYREELTECV